MPYRSGAFAFRDLRELMARASEPKSGDALAGVAATSAEERVDADVTDETPARCEHTRTDLG